MSISRGFITSEEQAGKRLDVVLAELAAELTRSGWSRRIARGYILVDAQPAKASQVLKIGDPITIISPKMPPAPHLPILYEDENVLVVDKPSGMLVHAKDSLAEELTMVDVLAKYLPKSGGARPGVVHRLDRGTSGVMIFAKSEGVQKFLQKQFSGRTVEKSYLAVVHGRPTPLSGEIDQPIGRSSKTPSKFVVKQNGKPSQTSWRTVRTIDERAALLEIHPKTGRTNQIRVHLAWLGHPVYGDKVYGKRDAAHRLMLHAASLSLQLPNGDHECFSAKMPPEFAKFKSL